MGFWGLFGNGNDNKGPELTIDMHNHVLPGLDDGAEDLAQSLTLIRKFKDLGYKKLIATPHIMGDFYKNTPEGIMRALEEVRTALKKEGVEMELEAAAEYYIDEWFLDKLQEPDSLLPIKNKYLLVETSYLNRPQILEEAIFQINSSGYIPVMAHPERYSYFFNNYDGYRELHDRGVLFQINVNSLAGYYSRSSKKIAEKLLKDKMVSFIGSDCHAERHLEVLSKAVNVKSYRNIDPDLILNNQL